MSPMVLTKTELIGSLQNEVRILLHLAGKIDRAQIDYRPTPGQRSTLELLQYLSLMGPALIDGAIAGKFDGAAWTADEAAAKARDFDQTIASIATQSQKFADTLGALPDSAFREEINMFGMPTSRGAFIVNVALSGYAAYRTQLFCYLKACGRAELNTANLWMGMDREM